MRKEIINYPTIEVTEDIKNLRTAYAFRAKWLYFLVKEMRDSGVENWHEIAKRAIQNCALHMGALRYSDVAPEDRGSLQAVFDHVAVGWNAKVMQLTKFFNNKGEVELVFNYCPLVQAWQEAGASPEDIEMLCKLAMAGDEAQLQALDGIKFSLDWTIAEGGNRSCHCTFSK